MMQTCLSRENRGARFWHRFDIRRIEDLANAVLGAELEAVQMTGPPARGSLAFAAHNGVIFSSGLINGRVTVSGALSEDALTLGIGLRFGPNSRHWLNTVRGGEVGVILPGDKHDAFYTEGSLYVMATLSAQRLEEEAERSGLVFDRGMISRTGLHPHPLAWSSLATLRRQVARIHLSDDAGDGQPNVGRAVIHTVIEHYARRPAETNARTQLVGRARIVSRAREYITEHLAGPLTLDAVAEAADTSRRTLARAFVEVLDDPPWDYVRRLRLHRIRRDLASQGKAGCSISMIASRWGINEPGRMSGWYRDVFGEAPSATVAAGVWYQRLKTDLL